MRRLPLLLSLLVLPACGELAFVPDMAPGVAMDLSKEKRAELLRMYIAEYEGANWAYQAERKKKFIELIARVGGDDSARFLIREYEKMGWDYHKNVKLFFVAQLGKTDSDLAADHLMKEYAQYSWDYQAERKAAILDALSELAAGRHQGGPNAS